MKDSIFFKITGSKALWLRRCFLVLMGFFFLAIHTNAVADGTTLFDFNELVDKQKSKNGPDVIEAYMENAYGSDITVQAGTLTRKKGVTRSGLHLGNSDGSGLETFSQHPTSLDTFLGNKKKSSIVMTFENAPITSVGFDFQLFPAGRKGNGGIIVLADGIPIYEYLLSSSEKKSGHLGHEDAIFFDQAVHTLQFISSSKKGFGIDNLIINIPAPEDAESQTSGISSGGFGLSWGNPYIGTVVETTDLGNLAGDDPPESGPTYQPGEIDDLPGNAGDLQVNRVPEPSSLLLIAVGLAGLALLRFYQIRPLPGFIIARLIRKN